MDGADARALFAAAVGRVAGIARVVDAPAGRRDRAAGDADQVAWRRFWTVSRLHDGDLGQGFAGLAESAGARVAGQSARWGTGALAAFRNDANVILA